MGHTLWNTLYFDVNTQMYKNIHNRCSLIGAMIYEYIMCLRLVDKNQFDAQTRKSFKEMTQK